MKVLAENITRSIKTKAVLICLGVIIFSIISCTYSKPKNSQNNTLNQKPSNITLKEGVEESNTADDTKEPAADQTEKAEIELSKEQFAFGEALEKKYQGKIDKINAKRIFRSYCANCHGIKGNLQLNGAKDLTKINSTVARNISQIYYGKGLMTPFQKVLKEEEIVAVAAYVQSMRK